MEKMKQHEYATFKIRYEVHRYSIYYENGSAMKIVSVVHFENDRTNDFICRLHPRFREGNVF